MKKRILLLTICTLISSCGLFKKTTKKINTSEHVVKKQESSQSSKKESEVSSESSQKKENESVKERDQRDLDSQTSIEADEITVDKNGNVSAKGKAKLINNKKDRGKSEKDSNKALGSTNSKNVAKVTSEESKGRKEGEKKDKAKTHDTVSEPSGKGIIYGAIGILIILFGMLWYFRIKRNK
ncbi:hypothetical protein [Sphingobacterium anhuiense]|uniref:hypothetical protein n=1 Tax=Sphingobacterium anhuiense TaxID=493780 RepID=UPI003C2AAEB7